MSVQIPNIINAPVWKLKPNQREKFLNFARIFKKNSFVLLPKKLVLMCVIFTTDNL